MRLIPNPYTGASRAARKKRRHISSGTNTSAVEAIIKSPENTHGRISVSLCAAEACVLNTCSERYAKAANAPRLRAAPRGEMLCSEAPSTTAFQLCLVLTTPVIRVRITDISRKRSPRALHSRIKRVVGVVGFRSAVSTRAVMARISVKRRTPVRAALGTSPHVRRTVSGFWDNCRGVCTDPATVPRMSTEAASANGGRILQKSEAARGARRPASISA